MSVITDILSAKDIEAALKSVEEPGSFDSKNFFRITGLSGKSIVQARAVFNILDRNQSGFIMEEDIEHILQNFNDDARALTDAETKAFLKDGDSDGDGKIGVDEFLAMLKQ